MSTPAAPAPQRSMLAQLLGAMVKQKASDLHLSASVQPMLRIRGELNRIEAPILKPQDMEAIINEFLNANQKTELMQKRMLDTAVKVPSLGVFRVNVFFQRHGLAAVFRALPETPPSFDDLRLPQICRTVCSYPTGLVLVTGPTGSGKSTTLAAMLHHINQTQKGHILTLEDPIEFQHESGRGMVNQRQLGAHFTSFSTALKAALREDPDVILVGEMRDHETISLAITAAETGHLVFATLHTNTAAKAVDRIIDTFPGDQQNQIRSMLSESLRAVICQKLVPTADKKGRLAIHDILVNTPAVANLIREGKTFQIPSAMQTGKKEGMQIMDQVLLDAVRANVVAGVDAWEHASDKNLFTQWAPRETQMGTNVGTSATGAPPAPTGATNVLKKVG